MEFDKFKHHSCADHIKHPSHAKIGITPFPDKLYVVTSLYNPLRFNKRYWNYNLFEHHVESAGAELYTAEIAFGGRPFEITDSCNPKHLQLRASDLQEVWLKENSLNLLISRLPADWKYVAWIDADLKFARPDWAQETLQLLQHYSFIQMFSHAQDLGPDYETLHQATPGFVYGHYNNIGLPTDSYYGWKYRHPGFAWAARREALDKVGGLIDHGILGSGDWMMANALFGQVSKTLTQNFTFNYKNLVKEWERRAERYIRRNVGYMPGTVLHYFHGKKANRNYNSRWELLVDAQFDPLTDLKKDSQGLYQLDDNDGLTPDRFMKLRDGLRRYGGLRDEDNPNV